MQDKILRTYVRRMIESFGVTSDIMTVEVRLRVATSTKENPDSPTVPDIMTNIRIIKGVSIVRQTVPIKRIQAGRDILELEIKYMPTTSDMKQSIVALGKEVRSVPGVEIVKITKIGGRTINQAHGAEFIF
jgi:hypothetical protein